MMTVFIMMTLHDGLNTEKMLMMAMMTWHDDLMTELFSDLAKMHQVMWRSGRWEHQYNNHRQSSPLLIHQNSLSWFTVINTNLTNGDESYAPQMTLCDIVIMFVDYLKPRRNIVIVDYLKPRRNIVNNVCLIIWNIVYFLTLRWDTAPWSARKPACPWRRAGGDQPYYDHYDSDCQHYNDHDNFDYQHNNDNNKSDHQHYIITMILIISITSSQWCLLSALQWPQ